MRSTFAWTVGAFLALSVTAAGQDSRPTTLTKVDRDALGWLRSLAIPDLAGRPYVHVHYHDRLGAWGRPREVLAYRGFLLDEQPGSFRVFCLDLLCRRLPHGRIARLRGSEWRVERLDIDAGVRAILETIARGDDDSVAYFDEGLALADQATVLAGACLALGKEDVAARLCARATRPNSSQFRKLVADALAAHCVRWFGEPDLTRRDLLAIHRRFLEAFPRHDRSVEIAASTRVIEAMVAEDDVRARESRPASRSVAEEIDDLIFALRDTTESLDHTVSMQDGWPLTPHQWKPSGTVARLLAFGHRAVPRLIEAIADSRPARCVDPSYGSFVRPEGHVNRVGGYALAIIEEIAGCRFYSEDLGGGVPGVQAVVREWWSRVQSDGEAAAVAAMLEEGQWGLVDAARRLARLDPMRATAAIAKAIDRAEGPQMRGDLVLVYVTLPGDTVVSKLLVLLEDSADLRSRLEAARGLHRRGRPEGLAAMLQIWNQDTLSLEGGAFYDSTTAVSPRHPFLDPSSGVWGGRVASEIAAFLASTDDPVAGAALLEKLEHGSQLHKWAALFAGLGTEKSVPRDPSMRQLRERSEELLIAELGNQGMSGTCVLASKVAGDDKTDQHLRWCDEAAWRLAHARPSLYSFDWATVTAERDRQISAIMESRRRSSSHDSRPAPNSRPESRSTK